MTQTASTLAAITAPLKDFAVAPENPRFQEPADEQIPDLAASLSPEAAGLLVPLLVRKGSGKKESPYMVVDGRRRLLALQHLQASGIVGPDLEITARLCETQESIAAAAIAANQQRLPLHPADIILAIKAMAAKKFSLERIAKALCADLSEIRKYHIVAKLPVDAITAFKEKIYDYSVLKLLARIPTAVEQKRLVDLAREQGQLWASQVQEYLDQDGLSENTSLMQFVGKDAYLAAGGRTVSDLLNELPDVCLDPAIAATLWCEKLQPVRDAFMAEGLQVFLAPDEDVDVPDTFRTAPYRWNRSRVENEAIHAAEADLKTARASVNDMADLSQMTGETLLPLVAPHLALARAKFAPMPVRAVQVSPGRNVLVDFSFLTTVEDIQAWEAEKLAAVPIPAEVPSRTPDSIPARQIVVETDHANAFHRMATEIAVRGVQRSLADSFPAALKFTVSNMFEQVVLHRPSSTSEERALRVTCGRNVQAWYHTPVAHLDQVVTDRLLEYRDRFAETGLRPYAWVSSLSFPELQDLLALMTAASVWINEDDTHRLRREARAQIQEVAEEIDHDIRNYWYPDAAFYGKCSKKQLIGYAERMGCDNDTLGTMKKAALADYVAEQGVARQWIPAVLSFDNAAIAEIEEATPDIAEAGDADDVDVAEAAGEDEPDDAEPEPEIDSMAA